MVVVVMVMVMVMVVVVMVVVEVKLVDVMAEEGGCWVLEVHFFLHLSLAL